MKNPASILRKLLYSLQYKENIFSNDPTDDINYLNGLPEPTNLIERSYFQYLCQKKQLSIFSRFMMNMISVIGFFYLRIVSQKFTMVEKHEALFLNTDESIIPSDIHSKFQNIYQVKEIYGFAVSETSKELIRLIKATYKNDRYFRFKCALKLRWYDSLIEKYSPDAILTTCEYSFTSSILTEYCHRRNVLHINIMHGEKILNIHDSFFSFDECYVWDEYYIQLFKDLKAKMDQFKIAIPDAMVFNKGGKYNVIYDYVYYLQDENGATLQKILKYMILLKNAGARVSFRLHPRDSISDAERYLDGFTVEKPADVPIEQSILQTRFAISLYSTVLQQAYMNGIGVVIDDLTSPELFANLNKRKYIMCQKPHKLLSDIINNEVTK